MNASSHTAAESIAAVAHGFATFDPDLPLAGIIGNRVGSTRHEALIREAMRRVHAPLVGFLPREEAIAVPSRHLGLHMGGEMPLDAAALAEWDRGRAYADTYALTHPAE